MAQPEPECLTNITFTKILPLVLLPPLPLENHVRILGESTFCWGEKNPTFRDFFCFPPGCHLEISFFQDKEKNMARS
jgi:hypothetical protein